MENLVYCLTRCCLLFIFKFITAYISEQRVCGENITNMVLTIVHIIGNDQV